MTSLHARPLRPTSIAQLREVTQPPEVRLRANAEHWTASLYLRDLSPYLTWVLLKTTITANGVTGIMILVGWATAFTLLVPGVPGAALALILGQVMMLVDCSDGEVARWYDQRSPAGVFLDKVGHYTTEALIPVVLGIRVAGFPFSTPQDYAWTTAGFALALIIVLNKALNDMVHVARANAGIEKLSDHKDEAVPSQRTIAKLRRLASYLPFHRLYHSVELTMLIFATSIVGLFVGQLVAGRVLLLVLLPLALLALLGHFAAIMASKRVRS